MAGERRHGTNSCYAGGCREAACRAAHTAELAKYRHNPDAGSLLVLGIGSRRRLEGLLAIGYPARYLSRRLGRSKTYVQDFLGHRRDRYMIQRHTAEKIAQLYDELCMRPPAGPDADRRRRQSARLGHASPLAWDDETIDDPAARPDLGAPRRHSSDVDDAVVLRILNGDGSVARSATTAERVETARRWVAARRPLNDLERLTGWRADRYAHADDVAADSRRRVRQGAA